MKVTKFLVCIIALLTLIIFSGCDPEIEPKPEPQSSTTPPVSEIKSLTTVTDAMDFYMQEELSHNFLESDYFSFSYRILDAKELSGRITMFAYTLCEWTSSDGEMASGGAGLVSVTFVNNNNIYEYEESRSYDAQQISGASEIPQKVKDMLTEDYFENIFTEMRSEVDRAIAYWLDSRQ